MIEPWPFGDLVPMRYGVIVADPPWRFETYSEEGQGKSPSQHYPTMPLEELRALPIDRLAGPDAVLVLWAVAPMIPEALELMRAWGFTFKTAGAWAKRSRTGRRWAFGPGYVLRSAAEFFLVGTIGEPQQRVKNVRNLIEAPIREHSRKPDELQTELERMFPRAWWLELFARQRRPGWDAWGNEVGKFAHAA